MISDIYKDALTYAGKNIVVLLKLGLLSIFNFLVIPAFLVSGYQYRVIKTAIGGMIGGNDELPEFNNWTSMLVDGVKIFLVELIYMIIPILILVICLLLGMESDNGAVFAVGIIIGIVLFIIFLLYSILAVPNMIANDSFKAAFDFKGITNIMKNIGVGRYIAFYIGLLIITFVIAFVVSFIISFILGICGFAVSAVNVNGLATLSGIGSIILTIVFSFIVGPYLGIFASRAIGLIYAVGE